MSKIADGNYTTVIYTLIKEKQYNDVIEIISNMSDNNRNTRPGLSLLAYCYYYTDDFQNASTIYEQLAALWPQETDYKLQHAQSLYSAGRYEDALRAANGITTSGYENKVRKLTAAIRYGMEDIAGARSLLETNSGLNDDPDTDINYGCLLYKESRYEEALQKFLNAQTMLGYRPHLSYSVALCYYKLKDFTSSLKHIGDIIDRGIREHPELGIGMTTEGIEVRSVGNTLTLHESALVEAFNLKAAIQFEKNDIDSAREAMTDMPPRWEEELDSVTLHNQALCSMDMSPTQGFHKLQFLMQQSTYPQETLQNLLILYCKHGYHDLASDVISTYSPVKDKYLSNYIREFVDAVIAQQSSPDEAYRKLDNMANKLVDSLRKATRSVQESREARDDKRAKSALLDYENTLEKFIPVTMAQAKIYWDLENYAQAETIFYKSVEFCNENDTWRLHVAHVLFMQEKFKEAIAFYEPIVKKNYNNILSVSAIVLANLCVSHIMTAQNEEAEELMRKIEKEEERLYYQEPEKKVFHLCIVNLVIGTLYCSKGNYEFGISRVIKSLEPYNKKLGMDTWFYAKRCMLSLIENMTKHIIVMRDSFYNECLVFLNQCEFHGKEVATMPDEEESTGKKELNNVTCEARLLKSLILRQLEY
ncbi:tetratricopeptide repeat protein 30A isoform X1 [Acyrthosiphon pisum]|uniref:Tetratricopeptide repeat protein 30 n=2 Tax=Acyrthosiphon pisum TaxID=7029 RepID=A0A8R1VYY1_ACYPI|nr:tetratricopeptide repeat protein 30A isoform X1 [Acyrthosiphon pisum]|eukprot:XP_001943853.2 PREDICTED: tetratricopeptide repeat protein 30A isoform X1 [Acyrthosiphon pisum]